MSEFGEPHTEFKCKDEFQEKEAKPPQIQPWHNLLTDAQKSVVFLEHQSMVDFIETDGEYIISAGRDHDINVWDAEEGRHVRRLSGHGGPVTGLSLCAGHVLVSCSEDGTVRQWSWETGKELKRFETGDLITCMGIINDVLAVTGDHKGYMDVRHLPSGDFYSKIFAHEDPIDALAVEGNFICSATFDAPSCLKVWEIQYERTTCIYRIENTPEIEFSSLAISGALILLGASDEQKLHVVNFRTDQRGLVDLERQGGRVQHVRVWNDWILSCSAHKREALLDVHRIGTYEHYGTFSCNMHHVLAMAAIESESSLKVVVGGSALAVLSFNFRTPGDAHISSNRSEKNGELSLVYSKNKGHKILKTTAASAYQEESTDFEENDSSSDDDMNYNTYNMLVLQNTDLYSSFAKPGIEKQDVNTAHNAENASQEQLTLADMSLRRMQIDAESIKSFYEEPRVAVRKLETFLDKQIDETENLLENIENIGPGKELIDDFIKHQEQTEYAMNKEDKATDADEENLEDNRVTEKIDTNSMVNENEHAFNEMVDEKTKILEEQKLAAGDNAKVAQGRKKFSRMMTKKSKSEKCKESKKSKTTRRCEII